MTLGTHEVALGQVWHLPSAETLTTRAFVELVYDLAGHRPKLSVLPAPLVAMVAMFNLTLRAVREQAYQVRRPFVVDHSKSASEAMVATLAWFRAVTDRGR